MMADRNLNRCGQWRAVVCSSHLASTNTEEEVDASAGDEAVDTRAIDLLEVFGVKCGTHVDAGHVAIFCDLLSSTRTFY